LHETFVRQIKDVVARMWQLKTSCTVLRQFSSDLYPSWYPG